MLYYVKYSGGIGSNEEIVSADNYSDAANYASFQAREEYESYEGLHGIRSIGDILEEDFDEEINEDNEDYILGKAYEIYEREVDDTIEYNVEEYDEEKYGWLLEDQGEPYEV